MYFKTFKPLLQNDYGEEKDCALTSITACTAFLLHRSDINHIYSVTELTAHMWGYSGSLYGTFAVTIRPIWGQVFEICGHPKKVRVKYIKGVGYNLGTIQEQLVKGNPVILSFTKINNTLYKHHTVTLVGFEGDKLFLYDNWDTIMRQVRYKDISINSSVVYVG